MNGQCKEHPATTKKEGREDEDVSEEKAIEVPWVAVRGVDGNRCPGRLQ
jgi:cation transport regulator ChaB